MCGRVANLCALSPPTLPAAGRAPPRPPPARSASSPSPPAGRLGRRPRFPLGGGPRCKCRVRGGVRDPGAWGLGAGGQGRPPPPGGPSGRCLAGARWAVGTGRGWGVGGTRDAGGAAGGRGSGVFVCRRPPTRKEQSPPPPSGTGLCVRVFCLGFFIVLSPKFRKGRSFVLLLEWLARGLCGLLEVGVLLCSDTRPPPPAHAPVVLRS